MWHAKLCCVVGLMASFFGLFSMLHVLEAKEWFCRYFYHDSMQVNVALKCPWCENKYSSSNYRSNNIKYSCSYYRRDNNNKYSSSKCTYREDGVRAWPKTTGHAPPFTEIIRNWSKEHHYYYKNTNVIMIVFCCLILIFFDKFRV